MTPVPEQQTEAGSGSWCSCLSGAGAILEEKPHAVTTGRVIDRQESEDEITNEELLLMFPDPPEEEDEITNEELLLMFPDPPEE